MSQDGIKSYEQAYDELLQSRAAVTSMNSKLETRQKELAERKKTLDELCDSMRREQKDVTELEKLSLSRIFAKIAGNYDEKYEKEYQEFVHAKLQYDEQNQFIEELRQEILRQQNEIARAKQTIRTLEASLIQDYPEAKERVKEMEEKKQMLYRQQVEVREAITAVIRVQNLTDRAIDEFDSAKGWSTYDTFFKGGLISDLAKYSHIDDAQEITNQMRAASNSMKKELMDVKMQFEGSIDAIDGGVRGFDIFFDNIFTDWSVRNRIEDNISTLENYKGKLGVILTNLRQKERELSREIEGLQL